MHVWGVSLLSSAARHLLAGLGARQGHCHWSLCEQAHQTDQDTEVSTMSTTPSISSPWSLASLGEETLSSLGWLWAETTLEEMLPLGIHFLPVGQKQSSRLFSPESI